MDRRVFNRFLWIHTKQKAGCYDIPYNPCVNQFSQHAKRSLLRNKFGVREYKVVFTQLCAWTRAPCQHCGVSYINSAATPRRMAGIAELNEYSHIHNTIRAVLEFFRGPDLIDRRARCGPHTWLMKSTSEGEGTEDKPKAKQRHAANHKNNNTKQDYNRSGGDATWDNDVSNHSLHHFLLLRPIPPTIGDHTGQQS